MQVGGEGPISATDVGEKWSSDYFASQFGALNVELEHRFYGESVPSPLNYTFLSSRQALNDLVVFIDFLKKTYGIKKVVTQGGSYPGNMAGWARSQFPFAVDAAIASSGPLMGKTHFFEYFQKDEEVLEKTRTGCKVDIKKAMDDFDVLIRSDQKKAMHMLNRDDLAEAKLTELDISNIFSVLSEFATLIQYATESHDTLQQLCQIMEAEDKMAAYVNWVLSRHTDGLQRILYNEMIEDTKTGGSWTWQTCTEFGYYQDSDYFTKNINMNYYYQTCLDAFEEYFKPAGIDTVEKISDFMAMQIDSETNAWYGGRNQPTNKIFYTNGDYDPWSVLSMRSDLTWAEGQYNGGIQRTIAGGSHCSDMHMNWKSNDGIRLEQLNALIEWLK